MAHCSPTIHLRRLSRKPVQILSWFSTHLDLQVRHLNWHLAVAAPPLSNVLGLPKPITLTHGYFAAVDAMAWLPAPTGTTSATKTYFNKRMFNAMPAFHVSCSVSSRCISSCLEHVSCSPKAKICSLGTS